MKKITYNYRLLFLFLIGPLAIFAQEPQDSIPTDSIVNLPYNFRTFQEGSLYLNDFDNYDIIYDKENNAYRVVTKIGDYEITYPIFMTPEEYSNYRLKKDMHDYYKGKVSAAGSKSKKNQKAQKDLLPTYYVNSNFFESLFGSNKIEVDMQGNIDIKMGVLHQEVDNPNLNESNRKPTLFDFDQNVGASVMAHVGERLKVSANYDTQSTFDFQDIVKIEFDPSAGYDDDGIIRKIDIGNVSMPIQNSLITGAQNLFGFRTVLQFGKTTVSTVYAKQQSQSKSVQAEGGAVVEEFELAASDYDANRHFFLAQYFKDNFNSALEQLPLINSPIQITKLEVWVTNTNNTTNNVRSVVAIQDLSESNIAAGNIGNTNININPNEAQFPFYPYNDVNELNTVMTGTDIRDVITVKDAFNGIIEDNPMQQGRDYSIITNARPLMEGSDYYLNRQLGYISLNRRLAESDALAVAFEYTINGSNKVYKVGELSQDGIIAPANLVVKLLRGELIQTEQPVWHLMMKNFYNLQAYQLTEEGFRLEVMYENNETGVPTNTLQSAITGVGTNDPIRERTLLNLLYIDRLDQNDYEVEGGDGYFDFISGLTIFPDKGVLMFPKIQPFGSFIDGLLDADDDRFVFNELYQYTQSEVQNTYQQKDKYLIKGYFKSEGGGGIPLGAFNVPQGSVHVTSGGRELVEGVDYVVDYQIGRVKIINPAIEASNAPINVSVEQNTIFNQDRRSFFGVDVEHKFSDNFQLGASFLHLNERPFTQKVNFGSEPIKNSVFGLNASYDTESKFLSRIANRLPFSKSDTPSHFSIRGDVAYLIPGTPRQIDVNGEAASYIDDFEGTQTPLQTRSEQLWFLASVPQNSNELSDLIVPNDPLGANKNRARLSWFNIDNDLYGRNKPAHIDNAELSRAEVRKIFNDELFPQDEQDYTESPYIRTLNLAFFPNERGSYNFDTENLNDDGLFNNPEERWGGITRPLTITDFENSNIEYVQFWLLDPFTNYSITQEEGLPAGVNPEDTTNWQGDIYLHLGNVSEDVLPDGAKTFENGLPEDGVSDTFKKTIWGRIPKNPSLLNTFDDNDEHRLNQDVGLDGLSDEQENSFDFNGESSEFANIQAYINALPAGARAEAQEDPFSDNFHFYRGSDFDEQEASIITRYKNYCRTQGNSPTVSMSPESYPTMATQYPDVEDINKDQTMSTAESYWEYKISLLPPNQMIVGQTPYLVDKRDGQSVQLANGETITPIWYQIRIPVAAGQSVAGISNFNSIRFMRLILTNFKMPVVVRMGEMEMVRGEWRRYKFDFDDPDEPLVGEEELGNFESGVVNIEENDQRTPVNYVLPPGIERERLQGTTTVQLQNEQSLSLKIRDLENEEARGLFKNVSFDLRMFKKLQMFIHAEGPDVNDDNLVAVVRIGSDLSDNYYQIEKSLKVTPYGQYSNASASTVWPDENELNIDLEVLKKLKLQRFEEGAANNELFPSVATAGANDAVYNLRVKGFPNLGKVKTIMLGIKNKSGTSQTAEIWFNELRVSDFDNEGGWSAVVSADANMTDLMNLSVTGRMSTIGYGNVDQSVNERSQEEVKQYDAVSSINVGKFMPENWGIQVPLNFSIGEEIRDPKYDGQYQDILMEDTNEQNSPHRDKAQDYTKRTSISLINVKKNRNPNSTKKARFYDVENLSVSYAFNEVEHRDYNVEKLNDQDVRLAASYNYSFKPFEVKPFSKSKLFKNKKLQAIKDLNFNLLPSDFSVNSSIFRQYNEQLYRTLVQDAGFSTLPTLKQRNFLFDWDYSLGYKPTKSIRLNFNATNNHVYDDFESTSNIALYDNFFNLGRPTHYHQSLDASYQLPLDKLPILKFIKSNYAYTADFDWQAASKSYVSQIGNTVQNANTHNLSAEMNMNKFYQELGLPKLLRTASERKKMQRIREKKRKERLEKRLAKKEEKMKEKGEEVVIGEEKNAEEKSAGESPGEKGMTEGKSGKENGKEIGAKQGGRNSSKSKKGVNPIAQFVYDLATSVKNIKVSYQENNGTLLPGYTPQTGFLGRHNYAGGLAPTFGFVFGSQVDIRNKALENNWLLTRNIYDPDDLTDDEAYYSKIYSRTHYDKLDLTAKVSPFKNFDIDVQANKIYTRNLSEQIDPIVSDLTNKPYFNESITSESGNFSMSFFMLGTAFDDPDAIFQQFKNNRDIISERLAADSGYNISGYGPTSQQVVLPAFLSAYSGQSIDKINLNPFRDIPLPNWQVRYRGLMKMKWFKKRFKNFSVSHAYRSSYSVLSFTNNLQYDPYNPTANLDLAGNYQNEKLFTNVSLIEEFSPLVKVDMKMKNSLSISGGIKTDRMFTLNFNNNTMTQNNGTEYVVGLGYRIKDLPFTMRLKGQKMKFKGDLDLKVDASIRDDITMVRYFGIDNAAENDQITGGQTNFNIRATADYALTKHIQAGFYYIQDASAYKISTSYDRRSISAGISFKYNLGN